MSVVPGLFVLFPTFSETFGRPVESARSGGESRRGGRQRSHEAEGQCAREYAEDGRHAEGDGTVRDAHSRAGVVPASNGVSACFKAGLNGAGRRVRGALSVDPRCAARRRRGRPSAKAQVGNVVLGTSRRSRKALRGRIRSVEMVFAVRPRTQSGEDHRLRRAPYGCRWRGFEGILVALEGFGPSTCGSWSTISFTGLSAITVATGRIRLRSALRDRHAVPRTTLLTCVFSEAGMRLMFVAVSPRSRLRRIDNVWSAGRVAEMTRV